MINDHQNLLSDSEAPAPLTVGTGISANVYRQGPLDADNLGIIDFQVGNNGYLFFLVTVPADSSGDGASINARLVSSAAVGLGTPTVHYETGVQVETFFTAGLLITIAINPNENWLEYIGMDFVISGETVTAFSYTALITDHVDAWKAYASGMNFGF